MRWILISLFVLLVACGSTDVRRATEGPITLERESISINKFYSVTRFHDDEKDVTCWFIGLTGVSCIPDSQLLDR